MPLSISGTIEVQDNNGQNHIIDADDMGFDIVETGEGSMGPKRTYEGIYEDEEIDLTVTVNVEEYPIGAPNGHETEVEGGSLIHDNLIIQYKE